MRIANVMAIALAGVATACVSAHRAPPPMATTRSPAEPAATVAPVASAESTAAAADAAASVFEAVSEPAKEPARPAPIEIHKGTRVLMFGDSMVHSGLGSALEERIVARGGTFIPASKRNATTHSWTEGRELQDLIARTRPDVVIIALASNELFIPNPSARIPDVRAIVARIGARPCVWIGPPPWLPEKGILGVVKDNAAPCRFFESSPLTLERQADGIHPTARGGKAWADAVWQATFLD